MTADRVAYKHIAYDRHCVGQVQSEVADPGDERVRRAVRSAGYRLAFGGLRGIDSLPPAEDYEVMRLPVQRYATALFRAQLRPSVAWAGRMVLGR